jgi:hypothetical protein
MQPNITMKDSQGNDFVIGSVLKSFSNPSYKVIVTNITAKDDMLFAHVLWETNIDNLNYDGWYISQYDMLGSKWVVD